MDGLCLGVESSAASKLLLISASLLRKKKSSEMLCVMQSAASERAPWKTRSRVDKGGPVLAFFTVARHAGAAACVSQHRQRAFGVRFDHHKGVGL